MFAQMFQRLSCGFYALYPSLACSKFAQVFQRLFALYCASLHIARLRFTFRWEGMAASTNCSSNVNCCATVRTYLVHREQRSTMTEERNSKTACSSKAVSSRCACSGKRYTHIRACAMIARVSFFASFHAISLERSCFWKMATLISIFSLFTTRWCHSLAAS